MYFPYCMDLSKEDDINDEIWQHLHFKNIDALNILDRKKFCIDNIRQEIEFGCSPCPDILSSKFGEKTSIMFISTVYGLIFTNLQV